MSQSSVLFGFWFAAFAAMIGEIMLEYLFGFPGLMVSFVIEAQWGWSSLKHTILQSEKGLLAVRFNTTIFDLATCR